MDYKEPHRQAAGQRKQLQPLKKKVSKIEADIESNETELSGIEEMLLDTLLNESGNKDELQQILQRLGELKQQNEELEEEWIRLHEELEVLAQALQV